MYKFLPFVYALIFIVYSGLSCAADSVQLSIVSQNLNRFFDDKDDGNKEKVLTSSQYQKRLKQLVSKIAGEFQQADLLAFQEVENIDVLRDTSQILESRHQISYVPLLIEGNDPSGIDVGYLVKKGWHIKSLTALFKDTIYNKQGAKLFSRPPLVIELCSTECFTVMNLHLRSMRGLSSNKKGPRIALKRKRQSETIARWIDRFQQENAHSYLIIAGDFNALTPADSYVDSVGTIKGTPDRNKPRYKTPDLVKKDLIDITQRVKTDQRFSYNYGGKQQQLDYILVSSTLSEFVKSVRFSAINAQFSDHAAVLATFSLH